MLCLIVFNVVSSFFFVCCSMFTLENILYALLVTVMGMIGSFCVALLWKACQKKMKLPSCISLYRRWTRRSRILHELEDLQEESFSNTEMKEYLDLESDEAPAAAAVATPRVYTIDPKKCNQAVLRAAFKNWENKNNMIQNMEKDKNQGRLNLREMESLRTHRKHNNQLAMNLKKFKDGMDEEEDGEFNMFPTVQEHRRRSQSQDLTSSLTSFEKWQQEDMCLEILWASLHQFAQQTSHLHLLEQDSAKSNDWSKYIEKLGEHLIFTQQLTIYVEKNLPDRLEWFMRKFFYDSPFSGGADYRNRLDAFLQEEEAEKKRQQKKKKEVQAGVAQRILQRTRAATAAAASADIPQDGEQPMDQDGEEESMEVGGEENVTPGSSHSARGKGGKRKATSSIPLRKQALEVTTRLSTPSAKKQKKCCQTVEKKRQEPSKPSVKKGSQVTKN